MTGEAVLPAFANHDYPPSGLMLPTGYGGLQGLRPLQEFLLRRDAPPPHRHGRQARP